MVSLKLPPSLPVRRNLSILVEKEIECDRGVSGPGEKEINLG
jgi:hypothetical protein